MTKKLLTLGLALLSSLVSVKAQSTSPCVADTMITDTLHYYFNKYYFKTGEKVYNNYPSYKSAAATVTNVTHCGSRFNNVGTMTITGLEAFAAKTGITSNLTVPVHLYLCNLDANNMPVLPAIDSIQTLVTGSSVNNPMKIGGNFKKKVGVGDTSYILSSDFAVLFRNMSTVSGDTVRLLRTAGATYTNMVALPEERSSDVDYGYVRYNKVFYSTRNYNITYGFGFGTDYEFMVAPRVKYILTTGHEIPQIILQANNQEIDTICTRTIFQFTNTSSYRYTNRFYNLIAFYNKWNNGSSFKAVPESGNWDADSAITWNFEYKELFSPNGDGRVFLPITNTVGANPGPITSSADRPSPNSDDRSGCFEGNQFRARLRPMSPFGRIPMVKYNCPFKICMKYCNNDWVGINENSFSTMHIYPNPLVNGKANISGLTGNNSISVYDVLGQLVQTRNVSSETASIDLNEFENGTYLIKVQNDNQQTKVVRVIKQN